MHSTLARFHETALQSGLAALDPNLANELHATMQEFERMSAEARKEAAEQREAADKANASHGSNSPPTNNDGLGPAPLTIADLARPAVLKASETTSTESVPSANRAWPYPPSYEDQEVRAPGSVPTAPMRSNYPEPPAAATAQDMNRLRIPAKPLALLRPDMFLQSPGSLELLAPVTYSFLESSFSRRLHRASLEKAQWVLSQPKLCEPILKQMFRVSYRYLNLCNIRDQIDDRLSKNSIQPLESFYDFPYRNFGGAGTHFTRSGLSSSTIPILPRSIGPPRPQLHAEDYDSKHVDDIAGLDGEWFNPDDVEGYLYEVRGIRVGEMASRVKTEILVESPILDHLPSTTSPAFGGDMASMPDTYVSMDLRDGTMFDGSQLSTAPRINLSTDDTFIKTEDISPPLVGNVATPLPDGLTGTTLLRRSVTIDVERLIEGEFCDGFTSLRGTTDVDTSYRTLWHCCLSWTISWFQETQCGTCTTGVGSVKSWNGNRYFVWNECLYAHVLEEVATFLVVMCLGELNVALFYLLFLLSFLYNGKVFSREQGSLYPVSAYLLRFEIHRAYSTSRTNVGETGIVLQFNQK